MSAIDIVIRAIDEASGPIDSVKGALASLSDKMLSGFGMGIGMQFAQQFTDGLKTAAMAGIDFAKTMEDTRTGIGAVILASMDFVNTNGNVVTSQERITLSLSMASEVQQKLKVDALQTSASYKELAEAFNSSLSPALSAGVTNLDKVRQITVAATQAMSAIGIPTAQASQEIRAMFAGTTGPQDRLNKQLQITKEELAAVKGNADATAALFLDRLKPYTDMAAEASKNFTVRLSNLGDAFDQTMGQAAKPVFEAFKIALSGLTGNMGGFQTKLDEIGVKVGGLVEAVAPYIPKLVDFALQLLNVGVTFLQTLTPVLPVLESVVGLVGDLLEWMGPMGIATLAGASAFAKITAAGSALMPVLTTLGAFISGSLLATLGVFVVTLGVVAAALHAVSLAMDLKREEAAVKTSYENMASTMVSNLSKMQAAHPELTGRVTALKAEILKLQSEGGPAVEKAASKLQKEFNDIAKSARDSKPPIEGVAEGIRAVAKAPAVDPKIAEKVAELGKKHDEVLAKIKAHIAYVSSPEGTTAYEKLRQTAGVEILKLKNEWGENSDLITARQEQLTADLQAQARKQAANYKAVPVEIHGTWIENLNLVQERVERLSGEVLLESSKQRNYVQAAPEVMRTIWDTNAALVKERNEILSSDVYNEAVKQGLYVRKPADASFAAWTENNAKSLASVQAFGVNLLVALDTPLGELRKQITQAWIDTTDGIKTQFESTRDFVSGIWSSMAGGIDQFFGDAFTGKGMDLQKTFQGIFEGIQKSFANMVADMAQRWLTGKQTIAGGIESLDDSLKPFQGSGFGAMAGNAAVGAAAGYGVGSMVGSASDAPGFSSGAAIGGAIGSVAGIVGMLVGAIIGGLIGALLASNTENHVSAAFSEMLANSTDNAFAAAGKRVLDAQQNWMVSIFEAGGEAAGYSAASLTKSYQDRVKALLQGGHAEISAGDTGDIEKGLARFLQENLPRLSLQAAFGQTGYGPHGNRDEGGGQAGLDWWINWMDSEGNTIKEKLYDPDAPIPRMLLGLGFTAEKIGELSGQLATGNVEEFKARLENLVGLVIDINKALTSYSGGRAGVEAELTKRAGQTTTSYFAKTAQDIVDAAGAMDALVGDEALARARQIADASNRRYEEELQAIQRIKDLARSISESISGQREDIKVRLLDTAGKTNYYQAQINALLGELGQATTEGEVQRITAQIQKFAGNLTDFAFSGDTPNMTLLEWIDQALGTTDLKAQAKLSSFVDDIIGTNDALTTVLDQLKDRFTGIGDASDAIATQAADAADGLNNVGASANNAAAALASFAYYVQAATDAFSGNGATAIKAIRRNPRVVMAQVDR